MVASSSSLGLWADNLHLRGNAFLSLKVENSKPCKLTLSKCFNERLLWKEGPNERCSTGHCECQWRWPLEYVFVVCSNKHSHSISGQSISHRSVVLYFFVSPSHPPLFVIHNQNNSQGLGTSLPMSPPSPSLGVRLETNDTLNVARP